MTQTKQKTKIENKIDGSEPENNAELTKLDSSILWAQSVDSIYDEKFDERLSIGLHAEKAENFIEKSRIFEDLGNNIYKIEISALENREGILSEIHIELKKGQIISNNLISSKSTAKNSFRGFKENLFFVIEKLEVNGIPNNNDWFYFWMIEKFIQKNFYVIKKSAVLI
jgi:hypothetical protein